MPFSAVDFLQALSAGILVGSAYALMCIGLGIIFGSMNVINFAQGDFLMLGMYAAFYLVAGYGVLAFLGPYAGPIVAAFLAGPLVFALGWLLHRFIVARVTGAGAAQTVGAGVYGQILVTLGISLILQNGGLILFGSTPVGVRTPLSRQSWEIGDILFNQARVVSFIVAVTLAAGMYLFLSHTRLGKGLRAAADNPQAAIYMGIDVDRAHRLAWSLGVGITAIASPTATRKLTQRPLLSRMSPISQDCRDSGVRMPVGVEPNTISPPFCRISEMPSVVMIWP